MPLSSIKLQPGVTATLALAALLGCSGGGGGATGAAGSSATGTAGTTAGATAGAAGTATTGAAGTATTGAAGSSATGAAGTTTAAAGTGGPAGAGAAGAGASNTDGGPLDVGPEVMNPPDSVVWHIDNLLTIGGKPVSRTVGKPVVIDTPAGKAVQFNGTATGTSGDALFVDVNPVAGYAKWTAEVIFRPDAGGAQAQRWFHMSEGLAGGVGNRVLFELRVDGNNWFLVSFVQSGAAIGRLYAVAFPHPLGAWYHVAIVIDGTTMKHYVNGVYENAGPCPKTEGCTPADVQMLATPFPLAYTPIGAGGTSLACRYTQEAFLKGAIRLARFTPRALTPAEFLPPP